ncbi:MAG TPA: CdaR family protein, partial [Blastocatellia bacterium]|nr:CdaR family protein [Blastocatellia bacterium]
VPILFLNLPGSPNSEVTDTDAPSAQVYLEGPRDIVDSIRPNEVTVFADMKDVEPGVRVKPLMIDMSRLPSSVKGVVEPREIRVHVERVIERDVPVKPRFDGEPPAGYEMVGWQITPPTVHIGGAESRVRDIKEVSTETVRLTGHTEPFSGFVAIDIGSTNVNVTDQSQRRVLLSVAISEQRQERTLSGLPVTVINGPGGARAAPAAVAVTFYGPRSLVDALTPADITVVVDYKSEAVGPGRFTPQINLAPNYADKVMVRAVEPAAVRVRP